MLYEKDRTLYFQLYTENKRRQEEYEAIVGMVQSTKPTIS